MKTMQIAFAYFAAMITMAGCTHSTSAELASQSAKSQSLTAMAAKSISMSGPEIVLLGQSNTYQLNPPAGVTIASSTWTFGDGTAAITSAGASVTHAINPTGLISIDVTAVDSDGGTYAVSQSVNVIGFYDGLQCLPNTTVIAPATAYVGQPFCGAGGDPFLLREFRHERDLDIR